MKPFPWPPTPLMMTPLRKNFIVLSAFALSRLWRRGVYFEGRPSFFCSGTCAITLRPNTPSLHVPHADERRGPQTKKRKHDHVSRERREPREIFAGSLFLNVPTPPTLLHTHVVSAHAQGAHLENRRKTQEEGHSYSEVRGVSCAVPAPPACMQSIDEILLEKPPPEIYHNNNSSSYDQNVPQNLVQRGVCVMGWVTNHKSPCRILVRIPPSICRG